MTPLEDFRKVTGQLDGLREVEGAPTQAILLSPIGRGMSIPCECHPLGQLQLVRSHFDSYQAGTGPSRRHI